MNTYLESFIHNMTSRDQQCEKPFDSDITAKEFYTQLQTVAINLGSALDDCDADTVMLNAVEVAMLAAKLHNRICFMREGKLGVRKL